MLSFNLPPQLTSFVGRVRETSEVRRLVAASRLVTLTGAGGCGRTRLALQAARRIAGALRDGVCWFELAPTRRPRARARSTAPRSAAGLPAAAPDGEKVYGVAPLTTTSWVVMAVIVALMVLKPL